VGALVVQYSAALRAGTAKTRGSNGPPVAAYVADTVSHLERFANIYGKQAANAITRSDVIALLNDYANQPSAHRRMHGAIGRMYAWSRRVEMAANDPTADIVTTQARPGERVLSLEELATVWRAASQLNPLYRDLVQLMILTGQRRNEVAAGPIAGGVSCQPRPGLRPVRINPQSVGGQIEQAALQGFRRGLPGDARQGPQCRP
jgi:site-specific recombinase XerD